MNPMLICFLSECNLENCLKRLMSAPFPNGFLIEAWNAIVGYSADNTDTHFWVTQVGTKSHLLSTNTKCLCGFSFRMNCSTCLHLVPIGSRASNTSIMTS